MSHDKELEPVGIVINCNPRSPDEHFDYVNDVQGLKERNPDFKRIFLMGVFSREELGEDKALLLSISKDCLIKSKHLAEAYH